MLELECSEGGILGTDGVFEGTMNGYGSVSCLNRLGQCALPIMSTVAYRAVQCGESRECSGKRDGLVALLVVA